MRRTDAHVNIQRLSNGKFRMQFGPPGYCMVFEEESLEKGLRYAERHYKYLYEETKELFRKATFVRDYFSARGTTTRVELHDLLPLGENGHVRVEAKLTVDGEQAPFSVHLAGLYTEEELRLLAFLSAYRVIMVNNNDLTYLEREADLKARTEWSETVKSFNKL